MLIFLTILLSSLVGISFLQKQKRLALALTPELIHLLLGIFFPGISVFVYNLLWMAGPTLGSFFLGNAFKVNLKGIFFFAVITSIFLYFTTNQIQLLLLFAGFNYLIQFIILVLNIKNKWTLEQGLFGIYFFGGVGSLILAGLFNYQSMGIYLCFYYFILIFGIIFGNYFNRFRDLYF